MKQTIHPLVLEGPDIRLEPLSMEHLSPLCVVGLEKNLWTHTISIVSSDDEMSQYIGAALREQGRGTALPFAIVFKETGTVVGSTRFGNIDRLNRRLEIGWTWIGEAWQRTVVNTETKFLMLRYAFEVLEVVRVEFKTDRLNQKSRAALLRIGAKEEGVLRRHMCAYDGRIRDTVYFSILDSEWEPVKARLIGMIHPPLSQK